MKVFSKLSYQKLRHEVIFQDEDDEKLPRVVESITRSRWFTRAQSRPRLSHSDRGPRRLKLKIAGLRKFLFRFKRVKVGRVSWGKVVKRFKESQAHFGDLFAGNYLFMHATPASLTNNKKNYLANKNNHNYLVNNEIPSFASSRFNDYALQKVA